MIIHDIYTQKVILSLKRDLFTTLEGKPCEIQMIAKPRTQNHPISGKKDFNPLSVDKLLALLDTDARNADIRKFLMKIES